MDITKCVTVIKKSAQAMMIVIGAVGMIISVAGAFVLIPAFIAVPIAVGLGLVYGGLTAKSEADKYDERQLKLHIDKDVGPANQKELHEIKQEVDEINKMVTQKKVINIDDVKDICARLNIKPSSTIAVLEDEVKTTVVHKSPKVAAGSVRFHFSKSNGETPKNAAANSPEFDVRERGVSLRR